MPGPAYTYQFRLLSDAVGNTAAKLICKRFGGLENVYIPKKENENHPISHLIGERCFARLVEKLGGLQIYIPKSITVGDKKPLVADDIMSGLYSNAEIALRCDVSQRYVRDIKQQLKEIGVEVPVSLADGRRGTRLPLPPIPHAEVFKFLGWPEGSKKYQIAKSKLIKVSDVRDDVNCSEALVDFVRSFLRWIYGIAPGNQTSKRVIPKKWRGHPEEFLAEVRSIIREHQPQSLKDGFYG
jgi:hypothetical protein